MNLNALKLTALVFFFFALSSPYKAKEITIKYLKKEVTLHSDKVDYPKLWKRIERKDPNSDEMLTYEGYDFNEIINKVFPNAVIEEIHTKAKDGYRLKIPKVTYLKKNHFLALKVQGKDKIYNKFFNTYFRWRPSYLLLDAKIASPYAVKSIELKETKLENPILLSASSETLPGAKVFVRSCAKCHSHKGFGGKKAPKMKYMIRRWKNKMEELPSFLRNPQEILKRKIQMSAFSGTEQELKDLLTYLKTI